MSTSYRIGTLSESQTQFPCRFHNLLLCRETISVASGGPVYSLILDAQGSRRDGTLCSVGTSFIQGPSFPHCNFQQAHPGEPRFSLFQLQPFLPIVQPCRHQSFDPACWIHLAWYHASCVHVRLGASKLLAQLTVPSWSFSTAFLQHVDALSCQTFPSLDDLRSFFSRLVSKVLFTNFGPFNFVSLV